MSRNTKHQQLNDALYLWFSDMSAHHAAINDEILLKGHGAWRTDRFYRPQLHKSLPPSIKDSPDSQTARLLISLVPMQGLLGIKIPKLKLNHKF